MKLYQHRHAPLVAFVVLGITGITGLAIVQHRSDARQDRAAIVRVEQIRQAQVDSCERVNLARRQIVRNTRTLRRLVLVLRDRATTSGIDSGFRIGHGELRRILRRTHTFPLPDCERIVPFVP